MKTCTAVDAPDSAIETYHAALKITFESAENLPVEVMRLSHLTTAECQSVRLLPIAQYLGKKELQSAVGVLVPLRVYISIVHCRKRAIMKIRIRF